MISIFITIFIAVLIGVVLIGPLSKEVTTAATSTNTTGSTCEIVTGGTMAVGNAQCQLYTASSWGATVLKMVPGFFSLIILGVVVAGLYTVFRNAGIV